MMVTAGVRVSVGAEVRVSVGRSIAAAVELRPPPPSVRALDTRKEADWARAADFGEV